MWDITKLRSLLCSSRCFLLSIFVCVFRTVERKPTGGSAGPSSLTFVSTFTKVSLCLTPQKAFRLFSLLRRNTLIHFFMPNVLRFNLHLNFADCSRGTFLRRRGFIGFVVVSDRDEREETGALSLPSYTISPCDRKDDVNRDFAFKVCVEFASNPDVCSLLSLRTTCTCTCYMSVCFRQPMKT